MTNYSIEELKMIQEYIFTKYHIYFLLELSKCPRFCCNGKDIGNFKDLIFPILSKFPSQQNKFDIRSSPFIDVSSFIFTNKSGENFTADELKRRVIL